ncbi:WD40 repeat domain-containing protein [Singulisphaera sp. PoT]|uniref:WD40 repeat domain-containing protein n=1 Tax=Singulisphaera sp. PoT TaxID=3411797 RepID=UPI003BF61147
MSMLDNAASTPPAKPELAHLVHDLVHEKPLIACRFEPKGRFVFATSEDASVVRWDMASKAKTVLKGHESWPFALEPTPDGTTMFSGGSEGILYSWDVESKETTPKRKFEAHSGWINSIAVNASGKMVATCGNDKAVRLWSAADGAPLASLPGHDKPVYKVLFDPSGQFLISADLQGRIVQWDLATFKEVRRFDASKLAIYFASQGVDYGGVRDLTLTPDGTYLVGSGLIEASNPLGAVSNPANVVLDWKDGKLVQLQRPKEDIKGVGWGVRSLAPNVIVMVSGGTSGGFLWFFKPTEVNEFFKLALPNTGRGLDLANDGRHVAVAHHDGHVRIYGLFEKAKA